MPPHAQKSKGKAKATEPVPRAGKSTTTMSYENGSAQIALDFPQGEVV